ncbi:hypothetical protein PISMIDRAFT_478688 [Pisolithus microcarpus 441]|uniref:Uncharacterized protein n=1 Tax=Pisolithus microcarpus 441 TaxID=765257 RepID=A0A0C9YCN4_9AGAM|nr:hypothetical protein PISMIDRAFT_478688 [Pisolithus microcarpus 441]
MKKHGCNVQYLPPVNRYPQDLRPSIANLLCKRHISDQEGLPISELPDGIFVGANDPWVVAGIIFDCDSVNHDADLHNRLWHERFSLFLRCSLQCFDMPVLPLLSSTGLPLCHALDHDYSEERLFRESYYGIDDSDWVKSNQDGRQLHLTTAVIVAVTTFLRNKKDVDLQSCRRCQAVCMEFFTSIPSAVGFELANSGDRDNVLGGSLSSPLEGSLELGMQEPTRMETSTSMLRNTALSKVAMHSQLIGELHGLRHRFDFFGLDIYNCLQRSDSGNRANLR